MGTRDGNLHRSDRVHFVGVGPIGEEATRTLPAALSTLLSRAPTSIGRSGELP